MGGEYVRSSVYAGRRSRPYNQRALLAQLYSHYRSTLRACFFLTILTFPEHFTVPALPFSIESPADLPFPELRV